MSTTNSVVLEKRGEIVDMWVNGQLGTMSQQVFNVKRVVLGSQVPDCDGIATIESLKVTRGTDKTATWVDLATQVPDYDKLNKFWVAKKNVAKTEAATACTGSSHTCSYLELVTRVLNQATRRGVINRGSKIFSQEELSDTSGSETGSVLCCAND